MKKRSSANHSKSALLDQIVSESRFVPYTMLGLLGIENIQDVNLGDQTEKELTILFADIRDFTQLSETMTPKENFDFINSYLSQMESVITSHGGIIDKFLGDGIMAVFPTWPDSALNCAIMMLKQLEKFNKERRANGFPDTRIGIGLNTGLCMLGTIGGPGRMECTVISDAVNLASRLETLTKTYRVSLLIGENTFNSLQDSRMFSVRFIDRVLVKGKTKPQSVYEVYDTDSFKAKRLKTTTKVIFEEALAHYHYKEINSARYLLEKCISLNPEDMPAQVYLERCQLYTDNAYFEGAPELDRQIEWNSEFEIGNPNIDSQHKELFTNAVKLQHAIENNEVKEVIDELMSFLGEYTVSHFNDEEELMTAENYTFAERQKRQHINFLKAYKLLMEEINSNTMSKTYLMFRTQVLLIDWIVNHVLKEDLHFGKFLAMKNL
jgi:hemerythrin-like metal-binding protein